MILSSVALGLLLVAPQGDPQAKAVWDAWLERQATIKAVSGKMSTMTKGQAQSAESWEFQLLKPGSYRVSGPQQAWVSNGKEAWMLFTAEKSYSPWTPGGAPPLMTGFESFFGPNQSAPKLSDFRFGEVDGKRVVIAETKPREDISVQALLDPATKMPVGWRQVMGEHEFSATYQDMRFEDSIANAATAFARPQGYAERKAPDYTANLLKVGAVAPDFKLKKSDGGVTSLKEELKGKKALLLNFWFYG